MLLFILSSLFLLLYCIYFFWFFRVGSAGKRIHRICYAAAVAVVLAVELLSHVFFKQFGVIALIITIVLVFRVLLRTNNAQALYSSSFFVLSLYSSRAIFAAVYSFVLNQSVNQILLRPDYFNTILIFSVVLSIAILSVSKLTFAKHEYIVKLLRNRGELRYLFINHLILILFFLLVNDGRFWEPRQMWYAILYLFTGVMTKTVVLLLLQHAIRVSVLIEYEVYTKNLQEQLERQIQHYSSYKKYTESFRKFKHDYKDMMASVKVLIHVNKNEEALRLIDEIHDTMQKTILVHKTYSNHLLIDAIMQDTANICEEKQIRFSAKVPFPQKAGLSDLDTIRIFTNVLHNAVEACGKLPFEERYIEVASNYNADWGFIQIANSYDGKVSYNDSELDTTKENKYYHGFGLKIVKDIIENEMDGVLRIETDRDKKEFRIKLSIPLNPANEQAGVNGIQEKEKE